MANHCIEVICSRCGAIYCLRGCGTDFPADKEYLEQWLKENPKPYVMSTEEHCKGHPLYGR